MRVPKRNKREWNESTLARTGAPVVNHPIVVDTQTGKREFLVGTLEKTLTSKARENVWVVDSGIDMIEIHVREARSLIPGSIAKIFIDRRNVALFISRHTGGSMQQTSGRDEIVEQPNVAPLAVFGIAFEAVVAALK